MTYFRFFTTAGFKFSVLLLLLIGSSYLAYLVTSSFFITFFTSILVFIIFRLCFGGGLKPRKNLILKLQENNFEFTDEKPLSGLNETLWLKGVGATDNLSQPVWVKTDEQGITLFYLCVSRNAPFIIPWSEISNISVKQLNKNYIANIVISGVDMEVEIPWSIEFNAHAPMFNSEV